MKIPECDSCQFYAHNPHILCAVHPKGLETNKCEDYFGNSNLEKEEQWSPKGYFFYNDELISIRLSRYTKEEQLKILNTHPFFTNICPNCSYEFKESPSPEKTWNCPECGWTES